MKDPIYKLIKVTNETNLKIGKKLNGKNNWN